MARTRRQNSTTRLCRVPTTGKRAEVAKFAEPRFSCCHWRFIYPATSGIWKRWIVSRASAPNDLCGGGISHVQRLPASITCATIFSLKSQLRYSETYQNKGRRMNQAYNFNVGGLHWMRLFAIISGAGIVSSLTDWFFARNWIHRRYTYPEICTGATKGEQ